MNSLERLTATVNFQETDRVPVVAPIFGHAAHLSGISMDKYLQDGALLAKAQIHAIDYYGYDMIFALMDVNVETEAVGSVLKYKNTIIPALNGTLSRQPQTSLRYRCPTLPVTVACQNCYVLRK